MKPIYHKCGRCHGTGRIQLTGIWLDTLALLRNIKGPLSGADLARLMGCKNEAMCNRLVALEQMGLSRSRPYGRVRLWMAVTL